MHNKFCNGIIHQIKQGENLYQLSRKYRVPLALILRANPYVDVYNLQVGQEICIPVGRPFHGMRPPMPMPREEERPEEVQEEGEEREEKMENEGAEVIREEKIPDYICDGKKSIGKILDEYDMTLSDLIEKNDLRDMILASDVVLRLPKKV